MIRILIAEDNELLRNDIARAVRRLSNEYEVIGVVENGQRAVSVAMAHSPDVVLMDVAMPVLDGIDATRKILSVLPDTGILGFSAVAERWQVQEMARAGARGYLLKSAMPAELRAGIEAAAHGYPYYCPAIRAVLGPES